ncbi:MAG: AMP-binding protein [Deltaproteobacteria bacterium]|nr:MAG: AMP-binding protein [Deltaproteobacteria bacterium]
MKNPPLIPIDPADPRLTLGHFLADVCARHGERPALRFEGRDLSYAELEQQVRALARALIGAGVVKGARVALLMGSRPEWVVAAFAAGTVGAVLVPVNTFATAEELDYILRHGDASLLLMQPSLRGHAYLEELLAAHPELARGVPGRLRCAALPQLRRVACLGLAAARGGVEPWSELLGLGADVSDALLDAVRAEVTPPDDGILIYTSGTTSKPKGVLHTQRAAVLQSRRFTDIMRLTPDDRVYSSYPFFWTAGIAMSLGPTLEAGGCLLLQETFEAGAALDLIERERATAVHAWPHQQKALAEHETARDRDLSALRKIDFTSPLARLAGIEQDEYGTGAAYGLSETFTIASMLRADAPAALRRGSSGLPLPGTVVRIVDPVSGDPLPTGREGEIAVKGVTLMRGYYKVLPENALDENGFFRTQDGGVIDADGHLHWKGRLSNLIKTGGANVSPVEIEEALHGYADLRVGLAVGVPHPTLGEAVVLCAVAREGAVVEEDAVRRYLRSKLAAYKVPKRVLFFRADELSYTGNQKIQLGPLREAALKRLASDGGEIDGHRYGAD